MTDTATDLMVISYKRLGFKFLYDGFQSTVQYASYKRFVPKNDAPGPWRDIKRGNITLCSRGFHIATPNSRGYAEWRRGGAMVFLAETRGARAVLQTYPASIRTGQVFEYEYGDKSANAGIRLLIHVKTGGFDDNHTPVFSELQNAGIMTAAGNISRGWLRNRGFIVNP